jgi:hypothetical protein
MHGMRVGLLLLVLAACSGGGGEDTKRLFTTKLGHDANLGGLTGADATCTNAATAANLGGSWVAWLSTSTVNAIDRIPDVGPWKLINGVVVFNNKAGLALAPIVPPNVDEYGGEVRTQVWTGTSVGGTGGGTPCGDWTKNVSAEVAVAGNSSFNEGTWTNAFNITCSSVAQLYCFEM